MQQSDGYERGYPPNGPTARLSVLVQAVCPAHGVQIGRWDNRASWVLDAFPEATEEQIAAARAVMASFDPWGDGSDIGALAEDEDPGEQDDLGGEMLAAQVEAGENPGDDESAAHVRDDGDFVSGDAGEELGDVAGDRAEGGASYPGIAILENELERRRNQILRMISDAKRNRLVVACDRSREDWLAEQAQRYIALGALGGDIPDETRAAYAEFCALKDRKDAIQREALQREDAAAFADMDQLQNIAVGMEQGWP